MARFAHGYACEQYEEGETKGIAKGMAKGMADGIAQVARNLLGSGFSKDDIA